VLDHLEWLNNLNVGDIVSVVGYYDEHDDKVTTVTPILFRVGSAESSHQYSRNPKHWGSVSLQPSDEESKAERRSHMSVPAQIMAKEEMEYEQEKEKQENG